MIFSELYSAYYNAVAAILRSASDQRGSCQARIRRKSADYSRGA